MDKLEQEIKNRLAQSTSMERIDSEALWNGISKTIYPVKALSKKRRVTFIWFFLSLMTIGSIWILIRINKVSSSPNLPRIKPKTDQFLSQILSTTHYDSSSASLKENTPSSVTSLTEGEGETAALHIIEYATKLASNDFGEQDSDLQNQRGFTGIPSNASSFFSQLEPNKEGEQKNVYRDKNIEALSFETEIFSVADSANPKLVAKYIADTGLVKRISPLIIDQLAISPKPNEPPTIKKSTPLSSKNTLSWEIYGGAVLLQRNFKNGNSDYVDSLNQSLSVYPGYSIGGLVRIKQGKNWNVSVGMEYVEWKDQFDKVLLSESLSEIDQEQVLVQNIRTVRHINTASIMTLPVQLGMSKDIERFRLGIDLGVSYSLVLSQNGRLLKDDSRIVNYAQSEKRFNNFLSARFAPYAGFKLNEKVMIITFCTTGIQRHGTNSINQFKNSSVAWMPSVGFIFNY